ncbi:MULTISPECIES: PP2C family protein-serine/threonine phosphatase [unclassified Nonomuraea]|uniref:PP2C family protein-serine/threonine phosphatase n=1 Tax=unclassified Nonomuraea TaxID=2593643 RepID=UPI0033D5E6AF
MYDAFVLPDGATALVIGDVVGHDLAAAAGMAQVCNMLRAYVGAEQEPPSANLDRLDRAVARMARATMATVVLARLDGCCAGATRLLLGTGIRDDRADAVVELPPESTLLLYTDGLIEPPHHCLDVGPARLSRYATSHAVQGRH